MKEIFTHLKTICLVLACLLGFGSASAQTLDPENGHQYRLRNVRNGMYLTMNDNSASTLMISDVKNSEYQFWELTETTLKHSNGSVTYNINNVGWKNKGTNAYLGSGSVGTNAPMTVSTKPGTNSNFAFVAGDKCYSLVVRNSAFGLNTDGKGQVIVLYDAKDAGSYWLLEEAEIIKPEVVTIKNGRSGKYMAENTSGKVIQSSTVNDMSKWISYAADGGIMLINYSTHNIVQGPAKNVDAVTSTDWCAFQTVTDGKYIAYGTQQGKEMIFLNDKSNYGNVVCGWTSGLDDAGNRWIVNKVAEITEEEVLEILRGASPYARSVEDGKLYRMYNETRDKYLYDNYIFSQGSGTSLKENDYTQVWRMVQDGTTGRFLVQNLVTGNYIKLGANASSICTIEAKGTSFNVKVNEAVSEVNKYFDFVSGSFALHMDGSANLVNWYTSSKEVNASDWLLCEVDPALINATALAEAQASYTKFVTAQDEYTVLNNKRSAYEKVLTPLFTDRSFSELSETAAAMSDEEFEAAIADLPAILKDMCLKVRNSSWEISKGGNNWEKFFRVADYKVYSKSNEMCWVVGMSYPMSRLSNPTGISCDAGDVIAISVDQTPSANATLMVEFTDGWEKANPRTGTQYALRRGLNFFMARNVQDIFIYYEINSADDNPAYYLDKFNDIKIHIEGGTVNGYYDLTRDMTDDDWADMVQSGMLRHGRVFLKGSHVVGNWPSSIALKCNPTSIKTIAEFYNNVPKWEQEIMGINNTYLRNIESRFRNVWTALGTDLGDAYMYATNFGTYYNWGTIETILSKGVLSNGGSQWGPAHEFGHNHQALFNMVGCTEVSNNVFSNAVIYKMGAAMSRGVALSELIPNYAKRRNWIELGIWCKTQMYWKLYQYFHLAGYDTEFYPKVFNIMRKNGLQHTNGQLVPASTDYLRFAEVCCEAAGADLTEFFQMYGFFEPIVYDTEKNGQACKFIDDYSQYYLYVTDAMINNTKKKMAKYDKKILNIGFIDDRIRQTPATYPGAPAGTVKGGMNGGGDNSVGTEGTVGMYLDYYPENYVPCTQYEATTVRYFPNNGTLKVIIKKSSGVGAMGFKVYSPSGELMYFFNDYSFTIPDLHDIYGDYDNTNIVIMAADAQGNDVKVYNPHDPLMTAIEAVAPASQSAQMHDLQGRRVTNTSRPGLYIVGGKKVLVK